jgi:hypothetical protein
VYAALVVFFSVVGVNAVHRFVGSGVYIMGRGYSVFWDTFWGVAQYLVVLSLYEALRLRSATKDPGGPSVHGRAPSRS